VNNSAIFINLTSDGDNADDDDDDNIKDDGNDID